MGGASEKEQSGNPNLKMYTAAVLQSAKKTLCPIILIEQKYHSVTWYVFPAPFLQIETTAHDALNLLLLKHVNAMSCNHTQNVWVLSPTCGLGTIYNASRLYLFKNSMVLLFDNTQNRMILLPQWVFI